MTVKVTIRRRPSKGEAKKNSNGIISLAKNMGEIRRYLLILSCSKRKRRLPVTPIPAIERYDGTFFRILRKAFSEYGKPNNLDIVILSAKHGLIAYNENITYYDQKMTISRAKILSSPVRARLRDTLKESWYEKVFINLGKLYMLALDGSRDLLDEYNVYCASGRIGERMQQLRNWVTSLTNEELQ